MRVLGGVVYEWLFGGHSVVRRWSFGGHSVVIRGYLVVRGWAWQGLKSSTPAAFKGSRVSGFKGCRVTVFQGYRV